MSEYSETDLTVHQIFCFSFFVYIFISWLRVLDYADHTVTFSMHVKISLLSYCSISYRIVSVFSYFLTFDIAPSFAL